MDYTPPVGGAADDPYVDFNAGTGEAGSVPPAAAIEAPQREIVAAIEAAGLVPDAGDNTQLGQAIAAMIQSGSHSVVIGNAVFEGTVADAEVVRWDGAQFVQAQADGTAANQAVGVADVTNGQMIAFGKTPAGLFAGLTPGARYYLDAATPGAITAVAPADPVCVGIAETADVLFVDVDGAAGGLLNKNNTWLKAQRGDYEVLVYAASQDIDMSTAQHFELTLTGNPVMNNPTNLVTGQEGTITFIQDATGSRAPSAWGAAWSFEDSVQPDFTTTPTKKDTFAYFVRAANEIVLKKAVGNY